jgi:L-aminoadipate-semialdehyde dehydrogenase
VKVTNYAIINFTSSTKGDRMYKTGDLGRYGTNGWVECFGRADDQVKIRGFRIELGEINAQLSQHRCVKENVTIVRTDRTGQKRLVSYVVPTAVDDEGRPLAHADVDVAAFEQHCKRFLKEKLPHYMVRSLLT